MSSFENVAFAQQPWGWLKGYQQVEGGKRPPWWRTAIFLLLAWLGTLISASISPMGQADKSTGGVAVLLFCLVLLAFVAAPLLLCLRYEHPFWVVIVAGLGSILLPIGNTVPFIALAALIGRRSGPAVWWSTALLGITSLWVTVFDAQAQPRGASVLKTIFGPLNGDITQPLPTPWLEAIVSWFISLGAVIGLGLLVRSRREAHCAKQAADIGRQASDRLGDEVARQQERERIAREIHDAMGHRLSLLNLHAGALESNSTDPRVAESAKLIRLSAAEAMNDLRSLLGVLRDPLGNEQPAPPLSQLAAVVKESFGAGQQLNSSIFISDPDQADPVLARAVYRIVQELLTNARKHAPNEAIWLSVEGGPASGIVIDTRNNYLGEWQQNPPGSARGLAGITERAELLGGRMRYGLDVAGSVFRVRVELPWRSAS